MRDNLHCNCHICKVERHLFVSLSEPPASVRFSTLASSSPPLEAYCCAERNPRRPRSPNDVQSQKLAAPVAQSDRASAF